MFGLESWTLEQILTEVVAETDADNITWGQIGSPDDLDYAYAGRPNPNRLRDYGLLLRTRTRLADPIDLEITQISTGHKIKIVAEGNRRGYLDNLLQHIRELAGQAA